MKKRNLITMFAVSLAVIAILVPSCKSPTGPQGSLSDVVFPARNVKYGLQVQPCFDQACGVSGCHDVDTRAGTLALDSWSDAMLSDIGVIRAGDTVNSRLVWRIEGTKGLIRMPTGLPPLNSNQINGLKQWILEGAQNN
jgi:hypothetical protein